MEEDKPGWFWPVIIGGSILVLVVCALGFYSLCKKITPWEEEAEKINEEEKERRRL